MAEDEGLFAVEPGAAAPAARAPVVKTFRRFEPDQVLLMPPSLADWLPEEHLARFVAELVDEVLDLGPFYADYTEGRGFPPHDPRLMVRLLVYGYTTGVRSSRAIERRCVDDVGFRFLAAGQVPASGRSRSSAAGTWPRWRGCCCKACGWRSGWGWSGWAGSRSTG